jgi:putative ABC transport system permease protein
VLQVDPDPRKPVSPMTKMLSEFRSAARGLARWRGGVIVAGLTLAIGIGTTTALYSLVRVTLANLPGVPDLSRVGRVYATSRLLGVERGRVALGEFDAALSKATSFRAIGAYADEDAVVGTGPDARPVIAGYASPGFFAAMAVPPAAGRVFTAADLTGPPVVVVSQAVWRRHFPDGTLARATLRVDGVERAVIGVMPPEFNYGFVGVSADLWIPLTHASRSMPAIVAVFARLRDDIEWPVAQAELAGLSRGRGPWVWQAVPITQDTRTRAFSAYAMTLGPAVLVLLIACVNVACLLMARGVAREKELTVRRALGATRQRVVRLLLVESLVLALVSGSLGAALAIWILRAVASAFAAEQPSVAAALAVDIRLLPVALSASAIACLLFGVVPAFRLSKRDVAASLNGVPAVHRIQIAGYGARDAIVFAETAAAVGFIVWIAFFYTLFAEMRGLKLTFAADHVVAMRVQATTIKDVAARVAAVPGVTETGISSGMLGGGMPERIESGGVQPVTVSRVPVGDRFLDALGLPLVRGRSFDAAEMNDRAGVAVLTELAARQLAPDGNAIGLRLQTAEHHQVLVIGVCRDPIDYGAVAALDRAAGEMYVPYEPSMISREAVILARVPGDARAALRAIADAAQVPPGTPPARPVLLSDNFAERTGTVERSARLVITILGSFAILTLLLAASGVFAVISQSVAQRTREFGIRLAIGATPSRVLRMVLVREGKLVAAAAGTGVVFTTLATRALFAELTELAAIRPSMWAGALLLAAGVAAAAVLFATYRIVRLEPAAVLRRL